MTRLICTRGLPASGKTTYAVRLLNAAEPGTLVRVNRDSIAAMLHGQRPHLPVTEKQITVAHHGMVESFLKAGTDVIVDDTLLRVSHLRDLFKIAWKHGADPSVIDFDVDVEECVRRDSLRPNPVGEDVIREMNRRFLGRWPATPQKPGNIPSGVRYTPNAGSPLAVVVDLDGTLALHVTRGPYDTDRYHEDAVNVPVMAGLHAMYEAGYDIVYCSGRDEQYRDVTQKWIDSQVGIPGPLFMRPQGDTRRDDVVKLELFNNNIRNQYHVIACIDDRDRVVAMYRSLGLSVWQVNYGDF